MGLNKELLDELVGQCSNPTEIKDLLGELTKGIVERAMEGELTTHLGYGKHSITGNNSGNSRNGHSRKRLITDQGELEIAIPRDRSGSYSPQIVPKGERRFTGFDEKILSMYSLGMSTRDIKLHLKEIYNVDVSPELISNVTEEILEEVHAWQDRPLLSLYTIVYFDAFWVKVHEGKRVVNKAVYVALSVDVDGARDVLGLWMDTSEGATFWLNVLSELQERGVEDILIACVDGLKGFPQAIEAIFPQTKVQLCIVHMVRNCFKYVPWKDKRAFTADMKKIYQASTIKVAKRALDVLEETWGEKYPRPIKSWRDNWEYLSVMFNYPKELRKLIYTTNPIESLNARFRKATKNKRVFPNDNSVFKLLFLALESDRKRRTNEDKNPRWQTKAQQWPEIRNQLDIIFQERMELPFTQKK